MARIEQRPGKVSFGQAMKDFFKGYVDFKGRTTRAGYWWPVLVYGIVHTVFIVYFIMKIIGTSALVAIDNEADVLALLMSMGGVMILYLVFVLATILPFLSLTVRRNRDTGITGKGSAVLLIANFILGRVNVAQENSLLNIISFVLVIFLFVITIMPTNAWLTEKTSGLQAFFLRHKETRYNRDLF